MYKVLIPQKVLKQLKKLDEVTQKIIISKLEELENGNFFGDKPLKGKYKGKFRKRAGDYRIIYLKENETLIITLIRIDHRKEVY
ncbi:MAG: type II toxin-antitoxin system RelE/ParE family toxin [Epsilonproteobacteria bacterium]|nr:type II toxin-antitoxin system RelE/ParE family toxin [Campylobacterota bacterium]